MATTTYNSQYYNSDGTVISQKAIAAPVGIIPFSYTIPVTVGDLTADTAYLFPLVSGRKLVAILIFSCGDQDSGGTTEDADLILRKTAADGTTHTDAIIDNAGTAYASAITAVRAVYANTTVPTSATGLCHVCFYVNTAAAASQAGDIVGVAIVI